MVDRTQYKLLLESIFERFPSVQKNGFMTGAYKPGLDRMRAFDKALGNPSSRLRFIHVAGTNGKGSVSSMLTAGLAGSAAGVRVGLYTSPHLWDFRERIKAVSIEDGARQIPEQDVYDFLTQWGPTFDALDLSFFEITTGMALWWFAEQKLDWVVMEVGLGGRLDSTNIIRPEAAVITSIGLDHCALLGSTRAEIAVQKAGIFKEGVPAIVNEYDSETGPVFVREAERAGAPLIFADRRKECKGGCVQSHVPLPDSTRLDLTGPCQSMNLRTVLRTLETLGVRPEMDAIEKTAQITDFRGRWERRMIQGHEVIFDIGHNPPALSVNFRKLSQSGKRLVIVYGIMADKDLEGIVPLMPGMGENAAPKGVEYIFCAPSTPRAMSAQELSNRFSAFPASSSVPFSTASSVREALQRAMDNADEDTLIYVGGSTFVVCEAGEI